MESFIINSKLYITQLIFVFLINKRSEPIRRMQSANEVALCATSWAVARYGVQLRKIFWIFMYIKAQRSNLVPMYTYLRALCDFENIGPFIWQENLCNSGIVA